MKALQTIFVLGDTFVHKTTETKFKLTDAAYSYTTRNFNVMVQASPETRSNNPNILARVRNSLVHALNKCSMLPKIIILVLEDDLIKGMKASDATPVSEYSRWIKWLINEFRKIIDTMKDFLPANAKRDEHPQFIWIIPTRHCNYRNNVPRKKLGTSIENTAKCVEKNISLRLVQKWDFNDTNIFLKDEQRFTTNGICDFWTSVDKSIEYYETKWDTNRSPQKRQPSEDNNRGDRNERHSHFYNDPVWDRNRERRRSGEDNRRRLPHPSFR